MIYEHGPHRLKCGCIMRDGIDDLMQGRKADLIYTDPPWGPGNIGYWQTLNHKDTGAERCQIEYKALLTTLFDLFAKYAIGAVCLEYGKRWRNDILEQADRIGFRVAFQGVSKYKSGAKWLPLDFFVMSRHTVTLPSNYADDFLSNNRDKRMMAAISPFVTPGGLMLDPFCGVGLMGQLALKTGMVFYGNEMNSKRLDTARGVFQYHENTLLFRAGGQQG